MAKFTELTNALVSKNTEIAEIENEISQKIAVFQNKLTVLREEDSQLRQMIKDAMESNGVNKFEDDNISVTYIAPTSRKTLDSTAIKKALPDLYEKYSKVSVVSASVRIKIKGGQ